MREQFCVGVKTDIGNGRHIFIAIDEKTFATFRHAQAYLEEFYGGPDYLVMSRHASDWVVAQ